MENILRISILISFLCLGLVNGQNYNVLNFGAKGDGQTDDSKAFAQAWKATCGGEGDMNSLLIPAGKTFLLQPIVFSGACKSTSIKIQLDGVIMAPTNIGEWSDQNCEKWIRFSYVSGLVVAGSGTINGRGSSFWEQKLKASQRPTALHFQKCDNLKVNGITSIDSPKNHISINNCSVVAISNIKLFAPEESPNTDGINIISSTNVNIFGSTIQTGDDCIAINTGSSNINIAGINCGPGHGISVGSLGADGATAAVSGVRVTHSTFNRTKNGARIKTWQGGQGYARDISFVDITLIDVKNPILINQQYVEKRRVLAVTKESAVAISSVKFIGFHGTTINEDAITLNCSETTRCTNVTMKGINITMADGAKPKVDCQYADGRSSDIDLMRDCFKTA